MSLVANGVEIEAAAMERAAQQVPAQHGLQRVRVAPRPALGYAGSINASSASNGTTRTPLAWR